jgi:hypothetical protein
MMSLLVSAILAFFKEQLNSTTVVSGVRFVELERTVKGTSHKEGAWQDEQPLVEGLG